MIIMLSRLWKALGIDGVRLELNTLGALPERQAHREALIRYFEEHKSELDEDALRRLYTNPLRILDTKNPDMQDLVNNAPRLLDFLGEESRAFLARLEKLLEAAGIEYTINPRLVRGLDYYNHTVFEWITDRLGAQGTICGGGRYDPLIEMLGGRPAPGVGFAMGLERVIELMRECGNVPVSTMCDVYVLHHGGDTQITAMRAAEALRDAGVRVVVPPGLELDQEPDEEGRRLGRALCGLCDRRRMRAGRSRHQGASHARRGGNALCRADARENRRGPGAVGRGASKSARRLRKSGLSLSRKPRKRVH